MEIRPVITLCLFALVQQAASQIRPIPVTWSSTTFGPDGPWQAVSVSVGTGDGVANVALYPGGSFDSSIFTTNICNGTTVGCSAAAGGLYDPTNSPTADYQSIGAPDSAGGGSVGNMNTTGEAVFCLDTMHVGSQSTSYEIKSAVFSAIISSNIAMPNGSSYASFLGNLALGSPNPVQTFGLNNGSAITGQLLTGNLRTNNQIPSSSYGLHIGSTRWGQQGSLTLGGYDAARVIAPVASYDTVGVAGDPQLPLIDINIGVQTGGSPFNTTQIPSLYSAGGNASIATKLNPLVPYMALPASTCAAIAQWLPVTYNPSIGLYLWNTDDFRYKTIISSPSYLGFTFQQTDSTNLTIKVPFSLLNLTLTSPIVASPKQYFPCQPWQSPSGVWQLGRAFLQAAYLSINWEQNKFFIAQAAGPNAGPSSIQTIQPSDTTVTGRDASVFQNSWQSTWTVIPSNATTSGSTNGVSGDDSSSSQGLSSGAKIGLGVGITLGVLVIAAALVAYFLLRRRNKRREQEEMANAIGTAATGKAALDQQMQHPNWQEKGQAFGDAPPPHKHPSHFNQYRHEMDVPPPELESADRVYEASQGKPIYEAPSSNFAHEIDSTEVSSASPRAASPRSTRTNKDLPGIPGLPAAPNSARLSPGPVSAMTGPMHGGNSPTMLSPESPRRSPKGMI